MNNLIHIKCEIFTRINNCLYSCFLLITFLSSTYSIQAEKVWKIFGDLKIPRQHSRAFPISDTEILVIGGWNNSGINNYALSSCEIIDLANDTILQGPFMNTQRYLFCALMLKDSNIIVISGCNNSSNGANTRICEIFERKTRQWQTMGPIRTGRQQFCADFINDHEIMIVGGRTGGNAGISETEIYDVITGLGRASANFPVPTCDCLSSITSSNKYITFGGREAGENSTRTNIVYTYDQFTDNWNIYGFLNRNVQYPSMLKQWNGKALITGGSIKEMPVTNSDDINIESSDSFILDAKMLTRRHWHQLAQYNNDSIIIVGGFENDARNIIRCEWYNQNTKTISSGPQLNFGRSMFSLVSMPNPQNPGDRILVAIGGRDNNSEAISSVEVLVDSIIYKPPPPPLIYESSSDCDNFYFTVYDSNLIDKVELTGLDNQNVKISTIETLPASVVHVIVSLIDAKLNGYFTINCTSNKTGLSVEISDTIYNNIYYLKVVSPIKNGIIDLGDTLINNLKCVDLEIKNEGFNDILVDSASLLINTEFYIPAGQLPITVPYGERRTLKICFLPTSKSIFTDTLYLRDKCDSLYIPVRGRGIVDRPPFISEISQDCFNYYFTITDSNLIDRVELTGTNNKNIKISVIETLPAYVVHVKVSLIDQKENGYFNIICYCNNTGLTTELNGVIHGELTYLSLKFPVGNVNFVGDTIVNAQKCVNLIIENKGNEDFIVDSAMLFFNTEFSIPGNQFPIIVPPKSQKQLTICLKSDKSGPFTDTLFLKNSCDTIAEVIHGWAYDNTASQITDSTFDCNNYYITVVDSNYINRVELTGTKNKNVKIELIENLPSRIVHIIISLLDPMKNGEFTLTVYCSASSKSVDFYGVIYSHPKYLLVLAPVDSGSINVGKSLYGELKCIKVLLQNISSQEIVLDYVRLFRNIEFSTPLSQLPVIIPAMERRELVLCYLPSTLGEQYDTLRLNDLCDTLTIPVKAIGDTVYYMSESKCIGFISGKTIDSWKNVVISNPYPNPGNTIVNIDIQTDINYDGRFECIILDNIGNIISVATNIHQYNSTVEGILYNNYKVSYEIDKFASGSYFIQIISGEFKKILPFFILR